MNQLKDMDQYIESGDDLRKVPEDRRRDFLDARMQDNRPFIKDTRDEYWVFGEKEIIPKRFYRSSDKIPKSLRSLTDLMKVNKYPRHDEPVAFATWKRKNEITHALYDIKRTKSLSQYINDLISQIGDLKKQVEEKDQLIADLSGKLAQMIELVKTQG